mmetsp:Transcript_14751/g.50311  ORF Transcript_14751/g.50311 Transcript_14751/m.50311 type:complete len:92 (-) Transcript_14751:1579-1854(-)
MPDVDTRVRRLLERVEHRDLETLFRKSVKQSNWQMHERWIQQKTPELEIAGALSIMNRVLCLQQDSLRSHSQGAAYDRPLQLIRMDTSWRT